MIPKMPLAVPFAAWWFLISSSAFAAEPKEVVAHFHAALEAGERSKVVELMAPGVAIYESGLVEASRNEYARHHLGDDMAFAKGTRRKVLRQSERIDGNLAVVWQETETTGVALGKEVHTFGTETSILEKTPEGWVIIHVHWSSRKAK
jgi:ketosteroid isomerase-like protein